MTYRGGTRAARATLKAFVKKKLSSYGEDRNHPDKEVASGLSPYLHFGHISSHEIVEEIMEQQAWSPGRLSDQAKGQRIHNYLRMLWGKKILHWSPTPRDALETMVRLNNRYAVDGRDPNSYTGIFWTLGCHDRAWGPQRPVFGKVRYRTTESTLRKVRMKAYLKKWASQP